MTLRADGRNAIAGSQLVDKCGEVTKPARLSGIEHYFTVYDTERKSALLCTPIGKADYRESRQSLGTLTAGAWKVVKESVA
jgi:hypothetical protein